MFNLLSNAAQALKRARGARCVHAPRPSSGCPGRLPCDLRAGRFRGLKRGPGVLKPSGWMRNPFRTKKFWNDMISF